MSKSDSRHSERRPNPPTDPRLPTPTTTALLTIILLLVIASLFILRLLGVPK